MFDIYLELYTLKMESIKIIKETIEKNIPKRINKEISKYQDAILMDFYFDQLLSGKEDKNIKKYISRYITINEIDEEKQKISYRFNNKNDALNPFKSIDESRKNIAIWMNTQNTMYNNLLISILIEFENIIAQIFREIVTMYPQAYLKEKSISYEKIIKSKDISEIKQKIISNEVELIMRESIFSWVKILENKHDVKISFENEYVKNFIESYLRRNIIVHNDSIINMDYINGMAMIGVKIPEEKIGERLFCTKEYIEEVIDSSTFFIIYIINQVMKLFRKSQENFSNALMNFGFQKIKNEEYCLAREIYRILKDNESLDQQSKIYTLINYWQTYKWEGRYDEVKSEIESFDISAYENLIKLAVYALRNDYEKIKILIDYEFDDEKQNDELAIELEDFPIFKQLRTQKFYIELREKYPDTFNVKSTQFDKENEGKRKKIIEDNEGTFKIKLKMKDSEKGKKK